MAQNALKQFSRLVDHINKFGVRGQGSQVRGQRLKVFWRVNKNRFYSTEIGCKVVRQRGSHIVLVKEQPRITIIVPNHKELDRGIRAIIRQADLTVDEFTQLL